MIDVLPSGKFRVRVFFKTRAVVSRSFKLKRDAELGTRAVPKSCSRVD